MYSRYADRRGGYDPSSVRLPPNYSGNAFPVRPPEDGGDSPPQPDFSDLPRVSGLIRRESAPAESVSPESAPPGEPAAETSPDPAPPTPPPDVQSPPARDGGTQPSAGLSLAGLLGQEEIILLGLCLLLLHASMDADCDRGDLSETLLLLGALLLWGK